MKRFSRLFGILILLTLFSCNGSGGDSDTSYDSEEIASVQNNSEQVKVESIERKLIKEGRVEYEVDDLKTGRAKIFEAVNQFDAYVASDRESSYSYRKSNTISVRIPAENFDDFLNQATQGVTKFDHKTISVKDVTEEFLDVEARLKTKKELEERYREILTEAQNVSEILDIERQIGHLRADIESIQGRLNFLKNQVSYSTLDITIYESIPQKTEFGKKIGNGFKNGWDNLIWFFVALINIWPFIVIIPGLIFGIKFYRRNK